MVAAAGVVGPPSSALTISGERAVGGELTVDPAADAWTPAPADSLGLSYQWYADGAALEGQVGTTLALAPGLQGATVSVVVTGTAGEGDAASSASVTVDAGTIAEGTLTTPPPVIVAPVRVGSPASVDLAGWTPGTTFAYSWRVAGSEVGTGRTYEPTADDQGMPLTVAVTGTLDGYAAATVESDFVIIDVGSTTGGSVALSGIVRVGSKVTASLAGWPSGTTYYYEWQLGGRTFLQTWQRSFVPEPAHRDKVLTVRVTAARPGYEEVTRTSTGRVVAAGVLSPARPRISGVTEGRVKVGSTLRANARATAWSPDPTRVTYRWTLNGRAIAGATASTYTPKASQVGKRVAVTVTGTRSGYAARQATSASAVVSRAFVRAPRPKITGTVRVGSTVSARVGDWRPDPSFRFQWKANGKPVPGATGRKHTLRAADKGKRITVTVTARRKGYVTTTRTSAATAKVMLPAPVISGAGLYRVGRDIKPGTYVAYVDGKYWCQWERRSNSGTGVRGRRGSDIGYGQRIVTIKSSDEYFRTVGCGSWRKFYPIGGVRTKTAPDGVYAVSTQLKPGVYTTSGPSFSNQACFWARLSSFAGTKGGGSVIASGEPRGAKTVRIRSTDKGFEAYGCVWRRIGS
ncbi:hypothetical protein GCM10009809_02940 [Isoptericola hypogeus]|uniref:Ig-like domain-containing protein n=1 Tax=Isoptericola hypogeus TaxID=300179 RepID=A0ABN2IQZ8_9MICO